MSMQTIFIARGIFFMLQFDVNSWLSTFRPKLADINQLVQLIVQGLECWNKTEAALIQGVRI